MKPIQLISQDVFDKIRSRFQNLEMGDETGAVTIDPAEARFFDFDFINEGVNLGRISVSLNEPGSLKVYYSQGITEGKDSMAKQMWFDFLREMRYFAQRRLLRFDTRDIAKSNLDKDDFKYLATKGKKDKSMSMNESRWSPKSSRKTSRSTSGTTEVIVRHHRPVEEMMPGARSRRSNIKAIFIQNRDGERYKYPFIHTAGAFAMAQHIDNGGVPHDPAGKAIVNMSEQIAQLGEFHRHVQRTSLHDDAMGIHERAYQKLQELKRHIDRIGRRHGYLSWKESFDTMENMDNGLSELDAVTMEQYKQKFTQNNFNEELAKFFPLIHSIMSEDNEVDLEEYVQTDDDEDSVAESSGPRDAFEEFERWAEAVEQGEDPEERDEPEEDGVEGQEMTADQIAALKAALDSKEKDKTGQPIIPLGDGGEDAWMMFSSENTGITDETKPGKKLKDDLEKLYDATEGEGNAMDVFIPWIKKYYPSGDLMNQLGIEDTSEPQQQLPAPEPQQPAAAPAPAAPAPAAAPAAPPAAPPMPGQMPAMENTEQQMNPGVMEDGRKAMIQEIAKCVKSFYNADNPDVAPFRTEEGVALEVKKKIEEMFGEEAGHHAETLAKQFMEKLTKQWEKKHGHVANGHGDDGLARLKELLGNIKQKVESIGDVGDPVDNAISEPATGGHMGLSEMDEIRKLAGLVK